MRFTKAFWVTLLILTGVFFVPLVLTWNAPYVDGALTIGFPLSVYEEGGWCVVSNACMGFSIRNLVIDFILILGVAYAVNLYSLRSKRATTKQLG